MSEKTKAAVEEKFSQKEYPIHLIGRHVNITEAMKSYAVQKLSKIERFGGRVLEATISMDIQKLLHTVDFLLNVNNTTIRVSGQSEDMYTSVDLAMGRLERKLRRYVDRLHAHHTKKRVAVDVGVNVIQRIAGIEEINDQIEEANLRKAESELRPHQIVSRELLPLQTLTQEEAIMRMELAESSFLVYRSEEDRKLRVIYRRHDSNYGIIEAE